MARIHSGRRGRSGSKRPYREEKPHWLNVNPKEVEKLVVDLAKSGYTMSMIGLILRDRYGIPSVKLATGKKIGQILEEKGLLPPVPEDLIALMKKAVRVYDHLQEYKKDFHNKRALQLIEAKILRLVDYYKTVGKLPKDWQYSIENARLLVR